MKLLKVDLHFSPSLPFNGNYSAMDDDVRWLVSSVVYDPIVDTLKLIVAGAKNSGGWN